MEYQAIYHNFLLSTLHWYRWLRNKTEYLWNRENWDFYATVRNWVWRRYPSRFWTKKSMFLNFMMTFISGIISRLKCRWSHPSEVYVLKSSKYNCSCHHTCETSVIKPSMSFAHSSAKCPLMHHWQINVGRCTLIRETNFLSTSRTLEWHRAVF